MSNNEKKYIIEMIQNDEQDMKRVDKYLDIYPGDTEIIIIKAYLELGIDNIENGIKLLEFVIKKCPFSIDALFLLGQAYMEKKKYYEALNNLSMSKVLFYYYCDVNKTQNVVFYNSEICNDLINQIIDEVQNSMEISFEDKMVILKNYKMNVVRGFWILSDVIRTTDNIIGDYFVVNKNDLRFFALYDPFNYLLYDISSPRNLQLYKTEMLKQLACGIDIELKLNSDALVPILTKEEQNNIKIKENDDVLSIPINSSMHFNYLKMKRGNIKIHADKELVVAEPIPLVHYKNNKRLVISLFVDGISQKIISEYGLENIMPNTYNFFKKGMICDNVFSASDWTYPSLSSLVSGLSVPNHMMIHPNVNIKFQSEQKLLFEYFKESGYHTTVLSGDWRIPSATYDSIRGVDRYIAKHQNCGFRTEDVINNVMDHLKTFKETDQYIWIGAGDFHDIADELSLPTAVQVNMDLNEFNTGDKSKTSVKQKYNSNKISMYAKVAVHIDSKLKILYDYIEQNYNEDEFVVTLFGDHGQAYMVKSEEFHLSRGMTNIGFMTRGGGVLGVSDEYINMVDYTNIITKLAGMENVHIDSDGKLPKTFGGEIENSFAISETIHPGDPYMIAMHGSKYTFYMESHAVVTDYGKVDMSEYDTKLYDSDRNEISDEEIINKFIYYVLNRTKYIQIY